LAFSPVPLLCALALYVAVYMAIDPAGAMPAGTAALDDQPDDFGDPPDGVLDVLADVVGKVWGVVQLLFGAFTFNVPDAPPYIRAPVAIGIVGTLAWSIATLIRGN
jgi:hypothetical protein